jgi:hypothetical protein
MKPGRIASRLSWLFIPLVILSHVAGAAPSEREKWIVGRWTCHANEGIGRPDRTIVFHTDHTWGVEHYGAPQPNGQLAVYEDVRGRRWHIRDDRLVLRAPSDDGFKSYGEKIVSFGHDKIVTDLFTYTREK